MGGAAAACRSEPKAAREWLRVRYLTRSPLGVRMGSEFVCQRERLARGSVSRRTRSQLPPRMTHIGSLIARLGKHRGEFGQVRHCVELRRYRRSAKVDGCWERVTSSPNEALAGATPYLRLFGSTLGGCKLAEEALAARASGESFGDPQRYVTLARFFAENIAVQAGSLERTVTDGADAVNGADACLGVGLALMATCPGRDAAP